MLDALAQRVNVPIIASGGAGKMEDSSPSSSPTPGIDAGLAASIFHTKQVDIKELKRYLRAPGRGDAAVRPHGHHYPGNERNATMETKELKFDANGLIPAIVQDHYTKEGPDPGPT